MNKKQKRNNKFHQLNVKLNVFNTLQNPVRITKIKSFINKYKRERINFASEKDNWKKLEKNNVTIALNVLYSKKENI